MNIIFIFKNKIHATFEYHSNNEIKTFINRIKDHVKTISSYDPAVLFLDCMKGKGRQYNSSHEDRKHKNHINAISAQRKLKHHLEYFGQANILQPGCQTLQEALGIRFVVLVDVRVWQETWGSET